MTMVHAGFPTEELRDEHTRGLPNAFDRLDARSARTRGDPCPAPSSTCRCPSTGSSPGPTTVPARASAPAARSCTTGSATAAATPRAIARRGRARAIFDELHGDRRRARRAPHVRHRRPLGRRPPRRRPDLRPDPGRAAGAGRRTGSTTSPTASRARWPRRRRRRATPTSSSTARTLAQSLPARRRARRARDPPDPGAPRRRAGGCSPGSAPSTSSSSSPASSTPPASPTCATGWRHDRAPSGGSSSTCRSRSTASSPAATASSTGSPRATTAPSTTATAATGRRSRCSGQIGLIVMGAAPMRRWPARWSSSDSPMAMLMNALPKVVFSQSLDEVDLEQLPDLARTARRRDPGAQAARPARTSSSSAAAASPQPDPRAAGRRVPAHRAPGGARRGALRSMHGLPEPQRLELVSSTVYADGCVTQVLRPG